MKTFVIGDIHGGYRALLEVLKNSNFDYEKDTLISLGDVVDGWSETHLVIEELMKIKNLILLKGNHDDWAIKSICTKYQEELSENAFTRSVVEENYSRNFWNMHGEAYSWLAQGGFSTLQSYENNMHLMIDHITFLSKARNYYVDSDNRLFVHAGGISKGKSLNEVKISDFYWDRSFWYKMWEGRNNGKDWYEIYLGHTPTLNFNKAGEDNTKPIKRKNVWNMDTGACYTGKLSMMNLETKELFQSVPVWTLYPLEIGRNHQSYNQYIS